MFQQPLRRLLFDAFDHIIQNTTNLSKAYSMQSIKGLAQVIESIFIIQDLLNNESRDSLAQLAASVHDPQAQRNDFSVDQKIYDFWVVSFNQGANNS